MSYCRWSSDGFMCDVYVYESADGWVVHVASMRLINGPAPEIWWEGITPDEMIEQLKKQRDFLENEAERAPIGLPFDGKTFVYETARDCAHELIRMRDIGYNVPQYAIDALLEEKYRISI